MAVRPPAVRSDEQHPAHESSWWGDRGVSTKILTAVGAAGVVAAGVGILGLTALGTSAATSQDLYASNIAGLQASADMTTTISDVRRTSRDALITPDAAETRQILDSIPAMGDQFDAAVAA